MTGKSNAISIVLLPLALLLSCQRAEMPQPWTPGPVADLGVLKAILKDGCDHPDAERSLHVYLDRPADFSPHDAEQWDWRPRSEFAVPLAIRSGSQVRWQKLTPCASRQVVDAARIDALIAQDGTIPPSYKHFREAYPNCRSIVQLSMPAYSEDGHRALVYEVSRKSDGLASSGRFIQIEGAGAEWHVTEKHPAWLSVF